MTSTSTPTPATLTQDELKTLVGHAALRYVVPGEIVGVGTGSTVNKFIDALASMKDQIKGAVSSSVASTERLQALGIPVLDANTVDALSVYIDGADEIDAQGNMVKGGGAALTREKIIAALSKKFVCIADESKLVTTLGQFPQHSMQPHTDHLRMWASLLAGESSIPIDELGFPSDNPSSDPAIQSQRDPLRLIAEAANRSFGSALQRLAVTSLMLRDGESVVPPEWKGVRARFAPSFRMSDSAAADAVLKQVQTMPWLAESPVILEKLGYDPVTITRLLSDKRRAAGPSVLDRVRQSTTAEPAASPVEDAQAMKAKFEALGIAVRAGVDPDDAAARLGLEGSKLTGAMPTSLRLPESDASGLEDK